MSSRRIPISAAGKTIGMVKDWMLLKSAKSSQHFLRRPPAIAYDTDVIFKARQLEVQMLVVLDRDMGTVYEVVMSKFWKKKMLIDRGHGSQYALPIEHWEQYPVSKCRKGAWE